MGPSDIIIPWARPDYSDASVCVTYMLLRLEYENKSGYLLNIH